MRACYDTLPTYSDHVLVDGSFDPLHSGHIAYLNAAAALSKGPLLCAVASDAQIRAKGREPLLPQETRLAVMEALGIVSVVYAKDRPTEQVIERLCPRAYVKGADWEDRLPPEQVSACGRVGTSIRFVRHGNSDHAADWLREWWRKQSDRDLATMERWIAAHPSTPPDRYDAEYFSRPQLIYPYQLDQRRIAEGARPDRIKDLWPDVTILDVGCGPGCLLALLRERGLKAWGVEPSHIAPCAESIAPYIYRGYLTDCPIRFDVVISREVLEHLTIPELLAMVPQLFACASRAVYITTRFHPAPSSPFSVIDQPDVDPTHQTLLTHQLLRALCVMAGGKRRQDWEQHLDFQGFGCTLAYEVAR